MLDLPVLSTKFKQASLCWSFSIIGILIFTLITKDPDK